MTRAILTLIAAVPIVWVLIGLTQTPSKHQGGVYQVVPSPPIGVVIQMSVTAYCYYPKNPLLCDHKPLKRGTGHTATGVKAVRGMCASDWTIFPPGSIFVIPGYGHCVIEDRGSEVKGMVLDVFVDSPLEAKTWGRQTLQTTLIRHGR